MTTPVPGTPQTAAAPARTTRLLSLPRLSRIAKASLIIAFFFTLDKGLGFVRASLFAQVAGLDGLGIFNASNNIPDFLSALISGGTLGMALIPVMAEFLEKEDRPGAWALFSHIANLAFLVTAGLALVVILLADPLVRYVIVPGFNAQAQSQTISLMRLDLLAILIFSISGLIMAALQANQHFLLPAMAPVFYNVGQLFGATVLAPNPGQQLELGPVTLPALGMGMGLNGMVYGVIIGAALHLLIQTPGLVRYGFHWTPSINLRQPGVARVLSLMGPRFLSMVGIQFYFIGRDSLTSHFGTASVGALNLGWFIEQVPETLVGTAIAIALLPSLAELFSRGDLDAFRQTINRSLRAMLALSLVIAVLLIVGIRPLVEYVFRFTDTQSTDLLVWVARVFLIGLVGDVWLEVAVRSYYAQQKALTPMGAAFFQVVTFLVLGYFLSLSFGAAGVALAAVISYTSEALLLLFLLNRSFPGLLDVKSTLLRAALGAFIGGLLLFGMTSFLPLPRLPLTVAALTFGGLVSLPFIWPEVKTLIRL